jgi:hypothetical protein
MGKKIPKSIQEKIMKKWFEGKTRDVIARELRIGTGSVSNTIKGFRRNDREFDLLRVVALQLRDEGITVESFAPLIRFRRLLSEEYPGKSTELQEEIIDALMEAICVFCFNRKITVPDFGNKVYAIYEIANKFVVELEDLPTYYINLEKTVNTLITKLESLKLQEARLLSDYEITFDVIDDILSNGPYMLGAYQVMKVRLRETENERDYYKNLAKSLQIELKVKEIENAKKVAESQSKKKIQSYKKSKD